MGLIRILLALVVVTGHTAHIPGFPPPAGPLAVECFFVISGFYMALVLERKYLRLPRRRWSTFMGARVRRLAPVYYLVLGLTALLLLAGGDVLIDNRPTNFLSLFSYPATVWVPVSLSNLLLLGQDWLLFLGVDPSGGGFYFTTDFRQVPVGAFHYALIPQAWTIALEVTFYALAPWLARRRSRTLIAVLLVSLAARAAFAVLLHLELDPWSYRFFPFELAFFVAGMLAYRLRGRLRFGSLPRYLPLVVVVALVVLEPFVALPRGQALVGLTAPLVVAALVPSIFSSTRENRTDRWIGELSYPLYLVHVLVLSALASVGLELGGALNVLISVAAAVVIVVLVDRPLERRRQIRVAQSLTAGHVAVDDDSGNGRALAVPEAGRS